MTEQLASRKHLLWDASFGALETGRSDCGGVPKILWFFFFTNFNNLWTQFSIRVQIPDKSKLEISKEITRGYHLRYSRWTVFFLLWLCAFKFTTNIPRYFRNEDLNSWAKYLFRYIWQRRVHKVAESAKLLFLALGSNS